VEAVVATAAAAAEALAVVASIHLAVAAVVFAALVAAAVTGAVATHFADADIPPARETYQHEFLICRRGKPHLHGFLLCLLLVWIE
jgi:hypothetical protein